MREKIPDSNQEGLQVQSYLMCYKSDYVSLEQFVVFVTQAWRLIVKLKCVYRLKRSIVATGKFPHGLQGLLKSYLLSGKTKLIVQSISRASSYICIGK